ncbi:MAG: pantoate--beta-alanine ligase [bacterium]|nr:pantoate--beta-alanine ligase [bacterium]MDD3623982.1 pantoate--beta-alanine ligase [Proteiniphilum sp.]MDD3968074.1 pantoate--beta-alanine ligase [Proteiniphilum sp.]MDD4458403.1 pantoate--beta-alanine ligase [Proteiniphilum sp.]
MKVIHTVSALNLALQPFRCEGVEIGFVPTMGALHEGHATLIRKSIEENGCTVVSLFVNPTQFNNSEDLRLYPRTPEEDRQLLQELGVEILFAPSVEEVYPEPDRRVFDFGLLDKVMEGRFRPGHFNGVAQVVSRLFSFVQPDRAYFGEKDFQQLAIVREMTRRLQIPVEIVGVPIVREPSGLAMSSRNQRLSLQEREQASQIYRMLDKSLGLTGEHLPRELAEWVVGEINNVPGLRVEYYEIVDGDSLRPIASWDESDRPVGCAAVYCGGVRLIDNISYR